MGELVKGSGGGKGGGGSGRVSVEAADSIRSKQVAKVVDLISEGEISGLVNGLKSIYLDDSPLQNSDGTFNIEGIVFDSRNGTQSQTHISGFPNIESETAVAVAVTKETSVTRTINDADADSARITISVPRLTSQDIKTGDVSGTSVEIAIDLQSNGGGFVPVSLSKITISLINQGSILSSLDTSILSAQVSISWVGPSTSQNTLHTIFYNLQSREVGSSTWTTIGNYSFSGSSRRVTVWDPDQFQGKGDRGGWTTIINPPTGAVTKQFSGLTSAMEYQTVKTSGSGTLTLSGSGEAFAEGTEITGKTSGRYQRAYNIPLTGSAPWDIRVRRLTDDSTSQALQNETIWDSFTKIIDEKFTYPNSALMALSIDSELFSKIPTRGYEIEGMIIKIPSNYNPVTRLYSGVWDGTFITAYSNNPAWVFYDVVTNSRYGLGDYVAESLVDKWALYEISQYCDEMVDNGQTGTEPRYTVNAYIQTREEALSLIQSLASSFAAMSYWSAGSVTLSQDSPKQPSALFTPANVINGTFDYSGSSARTRSTVISVTWNDPDDLYRQSIEYIEDIEGIARFGFIKKEVAAFGCTSRGQAHRFGKAILFTERMETDTVAFSCGMDGLAIGVGEVFQTSDPVRSGDRLGGRLQAATVTEFTLDSAVTIDSLYIYTLWLVMPDGTVENRAVTNGSGTTFDLTVSPAFSLIPKLQSVWVLGSTNANPETWRAITVSEDGVNASIVGLEYRSDKYNAIESDITLYPIPVSNLRVIPKTPSGIIIDESLYQITGSIVGARMSISWNSEQGARYEVQHRPENGNWITLSTQTASIDIEPVLSGNHQIRITSISEIGLRSPAAQESKIIYGLTLPPSNVTNFGLQSLSDVGVFTWDKSIDLDVLVGGTIQIKHTTNNSTPFWESATFISKSIAGNSTNATLPLIAGTYLARFFDSSGNQSATPAQIFTNAPNVLNMNFIESLEESGFTGAKTNLAVLSGALQLDTLEKIGEQTGLISSWPLLSFLGAVADSGTYLFAESVDLGLVQTCRITTEMEVVAFHASDLISFRPLISTWQIIGGDTPDGIEAAIYCRTSDDNIVFSGWERLITGDYTAKHFQFKIILTSSFNFYNIKVNSLSVKVDMPDRIASGGDIGSGAGLKSITYPWSYKVSPAIAITAQDMAHGDYYSLSNKTVTGFDITFKNEGGSSIDRTFDYIARGY